MARARSKSRRRVRRRGGAAVGPLGAAPAVAAGLKHIRFPEGVTYTVDPAAAAAAPQPQAALVGQGVVPKTEDELLAFVRGQLAQPGQPPVQLPATAGEMLDAIGDQTVQPTQQQRAALLKAEFQTYDQLLAADNFIVGIKPDGNTVVSTKHLLNSVYVLDANQLVGGYRKSRKRRKVKRKSRNYRR